LYIYAGVFTFPLIPPAVTS